MRTFPIMASVRRHAPGGLTLSFIVRTTGRPSHLLENLRQIERCGLPRLDYEIIVAADEPSRIRQRRLAHHARNRRQFPLIQMMVQLEGGLATSVQSPRSLPEAFKNARGQYILILDEDCHPRPGSAARMIERFDSDPSLAAAIFTTAAADGTFVRQTFQDIIPASAVGFRRAALASLESFPADFAALSSRVDLSLELLSRQWKIRGCDDLHANSLRPTAEPSAASSATGAREQMLVAAGCFPRNWAGKFVRDAARRQRLFARAAGAKPISIRKIAGLLARSLRPSNRLPIRPDIFESLVKLNETERRLRRAQDQYRLRRILILDLGPHVLPLVLAARQCSIQIVAIADPILGPASIASSSPRRYRRIPLIDDSLAIKLDYDAAVLGESSPLHASARRDAWRHFDRRPVIDLFEDNALALLTLQSPAAASPPLISLPHPAWPAARRIAARSA